MIPSGNMVGEIPIFVGEIPNVWWGNPAAKLRPKGCSKSSFSFGPRSPSKASNASDINGQNFLIDNYMIDI
jgi:hypothetical protein